VIDSEGLSVAAIKGIHNQDRFLAFALEAAKVFGEAARRRWFS